ncbi:MAG: ATP:cob(I)alamin adenosyltransferase, partial [Patescibacteria group bacterium]|nr:ATP:cob(I)alamin adenosyltransferase [Patescibacteria group bacterium]
MKLYTKTGDFGETSLFGGKRISKSALQIEAYGSIDELNSFIGLATTEIGQIDIRHFRQLFV